MDRDIEKEGNSRETAVEDSRKRLWHAGDVFFFSLFGVGWGVGLCCQTGQRWKPVLQVN